MTLAELIAEVYTITGRPDRVAETLSAVKSATLKAHQKDFYYKDLFEAGIVFTTAEYVQNLDYRSLLPRWRAVKYLRKYDNTSGDPGAFLTLITPGEVLDDYSAQRQDIFYVAGQYVQINSSTEEQYYLLGAYLNPDITDTGYSSWIALDHPYAIVYEAVVTVMKAIGEDDKASIYAKMAQEQQALISLSNIQSVGY